VESATISTLDPREFRRALGHFATGVTVVTAEHGGKPFGATISAVSALSAESPMALVCLNQNLGTHAAIQETGRFTINILSDEQGQLARTFATPNADKFGDAAWAATPHGPRLPEAIGTFSCVDQCPGPGEHLPTDQRTPPLAMGCAARDVREVQRHPAVPRQTLDDAAHRIPGGWPAHPIGARRARFRRHGGTGSRAADAEKRSNYASVRYQPEYAREQYVRDGYYRETAQV